MLHKSNSVVEVVSCDELLDQCQIATLAIKLVNSPAVAGSVKMEEILKLNNDCDKAATLNAFTLDNEATVKDLTVSPVIPSVECESRLAAGNECGAKMFAVTAELTKYGMMFLPDVSQLGPLYVCGLRRVV